jgi:hypothetical protein
VRVVHLSVGSSSIRTTNASQRFRQEVRIKFCSTQKEFVCWTSSDMCCNLVATTKKENEERWMRECASCNYKSSTGVREEVNRRRMWGK